MTDAQMIALVQILFPLVVSACVYLYKRFVPPSKQSQLAHASSIVGAVVQGVEQTCLIMQGPDKKAEAVRVLTGLLREAHITVSPMLLSVLVEQAVYALNQDHQATQIVPVVK